MKILSIFHTKPGRTNIWGVTLCELPKEYKEGDLERIVELGAGWVRLHIPWRYVEKEKGVFDFSFYDKLIDRIEEKGLNVLAAVGCAYSQMLPDRILKENDICLDLPSYLPQLKRYVTETVAHFKDKVAIWQAENEINHTELHVVPGGWRRPAWILDQKKEIQILFCIISGIRENTSKSQIMVNLECDNPNWQKSLKAYTRSLSFDIIGIDFYPSYSFIPCDPINSFPNRILRLSEIIDTALSFKKKVIVAEIGYPAPKENYSEENQAAYIHHACQALLTTKAKGIFIWELTDQTSKEPEFPEYYFGLLDKDRTTKASFEVYKEEILQSKQTILVSVKGLLFREPKGCVDVYINEELAGKTNLDGLFMSEVLSPGKYKIKIKGWLAWQKRSRQIELLQGRPQRIKFRM